MLHETDIRNLIEEYKFCHEKATKVEEYIWTTASIFAIGSIVGIATLSKDNIIGLNPHLSVVVGLLAIGVLLTWRRFARRWWSIQGVMLIRMKEIEELLDLNINRYVDKIDNIWKDRNEGIFEKIKNILNKSAEDHEYHGIRPMVSFFIFVNILAWGVFIIFQTIPGDPTLYDLINKYVFSIKLKSFVIFMYFVLFIVSLFVYYRKN